MLRHFGYACIALDGPASTNRGTVLRNATPERLLELTARNLDGLHAVLKYNVSIGVQLFRVSSQVVPFGSHPVNTTRWWDVFADELAALGRFIRHHEMRVSMHPGQYTLLSAPDPKVLAASIRDLEFHARLFDTMDLDTTHKLVTHGGGLYGDRAAAHTRWAANYAALPESIRRRLILENDERLYGANDVLELAARTGVPVVFDVFHHRVMAGSDQRLPALLAAAFATWDPITDGLPKVHLSSQAPTQRPGAHAAYVEAADLETFLAVAPLAPDFDCMLEAKAKERALLELRRSSALRPARSGAG